MILILFYQLSQYLYTIRLTFNAKNFQHFLQYSPFINLDDFSHQQELL